MSEYKPHKILFVIPNLAIGGINTALQCILKNININCDIFAISDDGNCQYGTLLLPKSKILSAYYCDYSLHKHNVYILLVKLVKRFFIKIHIDIEPLLAKVISKKIIKKSPYNLVIAFSEGFTTKFTSYFTTNKIAWIHCDYDYYLSKEKTELNIYNKYDKIICVSRFTQNIFQKRYPSLAFKTTFIHNLLNIKLITAAAKENINLSNPTKINIISIGRIHPIKRFNIIPFIARNLKNKSIDFQWFIIGPVADKYEFFLLKENIVKYDVTEEVIYLGAKENPYPFLSQSDILVCLSESEACPMIFNEAKVLKVPIFSTNFGSAKEFVKENENGYISTFEGVSDCLVNILSNESQLNALKEKMKTKAYSNAPSISKINKIIKFYE